MRKFHFLIKFTICIICFSYFFSSCNYSKKNLNHSTRTDDSIEVSKLLLSVYKWHENKDLDFPIIVKDSFQIGIDTLKLESTLNELKETNYFTADFLNNFEKIGRRIDFTLRNAPVKYLNEINFPFQDADSWTYFQDEASWDGFKIIEMSISADSASLKWIIDGNYPTNPYLVKFKRDKRNWKISYLEGFDLNLY